MTVGPSSGGFHVFNFARRLASPSGDFSGGFINSDSEGGSSN